MNTLERHQLKNLNLEAKSPKITCVDSLECVIKCTGGITWRPCGMSTTLRGKGGIGRF